MLLPARDRKRVSGEKTESFNDLTTGKKRQLKFLVLNPKQRQKLTGNAWSVPDKRHLLYPLKDLYKLRVEVAADLNESTLI